MKETFITNLFDFGIGSVKWGRNLGKEGKFNPKESQGSLVLTILILACRELWLDYFHEMHKDQFSVLLTSRWLHSTPAQQVTLGANLAGEITPTSCALWACVICCSTSWLWPYHYPAGPQLSISKIIAWICSQWDLSPCLLQKLALT